MDSLPDVPLIKILNYVAFSPACAPACVCGGYQVNLLYVCKRWTNLLLTLSYISIFADETDNYDIALRKLIIVFYRDICNLCFERGIHFDQDLTTKVNKVAFYNYFSARRITFAVFEKTNLFYTRIYDKWGRKCVNKCCDYDNCQGSLIAKDSEVASSTYIKETEAFPYYFFYYYKCRFVSHIENSVSEESNITYPNLIRAKRELFRRSHEFINDVTKALQPQKINEKYVGRLSRLLATGEKMYKPYTLNPLGLYYKASQALSLPNLRLQVANEPDVHDQTDRDNEVNF